MPDRHARRCHQRLRFGDGVLAEVEDRGGEHGVGAAEHHTVDEVLQGAYAAARHHRHADRIADGPRQLEVEALSRAVAIHRREQDLPDTALGRLGRPGQDVDAGRGATAVQVHLEGAFGKSADDGPRRLASIAHTTHCEPNSPAISPISSGRWTAAVFTLTLSAPARSIRRASSSERIPPPTVNGMNTCSADPVHHVDRRLTGVARRRDVEEHQLVGALGVVAGGQLDRITGVAQVDEVGALDDPPVGDVEAGNDPGHLHRRTPASTASASGIVNRPSYRARPVMMPPNPGIAARAATSSSVATPPLAMTGIGGAGGRGREAVDVRPAEHAVASDVGDHERGGGREPPERLVEPHTAARRPAVDGHLTVTMVETDRDREHGCGAFDERRVRRSPPTPSRPARLRVGRAPRRHRPPALPHRSAPARLRRRPRRSPRRTSGSSDPPTGRRRGRRRGSTARRRRRTTAATAAGSSPYTVSASKSPCARRTTRPPSRSIAG